MTDAARAGAGETLEASPAPAVAAPPLNRPRAALIALAVLLTLALVGVLLAGPALYRAGALDLETATWGVASIAWYAAIAAAVVSAVGIVWSAIGKRSRGVIVGIMTLTAALLVGFRVYSYRLAHDALPPTHDAQTDWTKPVAFSLKTLEAREAAGAAPLRDDALVESEGRWAGMSVAQAQAEAFDLKPLLVSAPPAEATVAAAEAARRMGWTVLLDDPPNGQVEAVTHSYWYGLAADIAVRVTAQGEGARIDVRSVGRTAAPDMGANAQRIKVLLDDVAFALRGAEAGAAG
jgi:fatty-acyl-CoA synthase